MKNVTLVNVKMNDGTILENVEIEDYDASKIAEKLNDNSNNMVAIGEIVAQRYSIVRITPIDLDFDKEEVIVE